MNYYSYFSSPIGKLLLVGSKDYLTNLYLPNDGVVKTPLETWQEAEKTNAEVMFIDVKKQLDDYFSGKLITKFKLPIKLTVTKFQQQVLQAVSEIPYGLTSSYSEVAEKIGNSNAVRAVGGANAANPLPLIIPCHRVIGKDRKLVGFVGGSDVYMKKYLLDMESAKYASC